MQAARQRDTKEFISSVIVGNRIPITDVTVRPFGVSADRSRRFAIVTHAGGAVADNISVFITAAGKPNR